MNDQKFEPLKTVYEHPFFSNVLPSFFEEALQKRNRLGIEPPVNIAENEKDWQIEVAAPGYNKEDFKIKLEKDTLVVSGEAKQDTVKHKRQYSRQEFSLTSFSRSFRMPVGKVNEEGILANYQNGVLTISIPKILSESAKTLKEIIVS